MIDPLWERLQPGERQLAFLELQQIEWQAWRDVMTELERFGVGDVNAGGEHERLHDAITRWGEELVQLRVHDPQWEHAVNAQHERRQAWQRWRT
jgi:hypothetical protein